MPFEKGRVKTGGVKKGYAAALKDPVKRTVREIVEQALGKTLPQALLDIAAAQEKTPAGQKEAKDIYIALLPYAHPKLQSMEVKADVETTLSKDKQIEEAFNEIVELAKMKINDK